ncbi:cytochrome P450, partial [Achaetomium macrosporum]
MFRFIPSVIQIAASAASGLLAHWCYFVHGEHDLQAVNIARMHVLLILALPYVKSQLEGIPTRQSVLESSILAGVYMVVLFTSIVVYRLYVSPLRNVPGPLAMRISKLVHVVDNGPTEITAFGWDAYYQVHGPESKTNRSAYYDILYPMVSLDTTRDNAVHAIRRRLWEQAFSIKALDQNLVLVYKYADLLVEQLRRREGSPLDLGRWCEYYSFDLMGMLGLTIDFKNLTDGEHPIMWLWHIAHQKLGALNSAPWVKHLLMGIPGIKRMKYYRRFMNWANEELQRNIRDNKGERSNIIGLVLRDAMQHGGIEANWNFILGDFVLVVAAGSDPIRQSLPCLMYYLLRNPSHLARVRDELSSIDIRNYHALQHLPHFNACIYETLRLNPPAPSTGLRSSPKGGMTISGTFIPEGTTICTPQYSLMRDEACFLQAEEWIPERFTTRPDLMPNKNAFVPWSI